MKHWKQATFLKLARVPGSIVFLPTTGDRYLLQDDSNGKGTPRLRPPGGGREKADATDLEVIARECKEEFGISPVKLKQHIKLLGFEPRAKYFGTAVFEFRQHGLKPGVYQATNDPKEKITLVESTLDDPDYVGPDKSALLTREEKADREKEDPTLSKEASSVAQFIQKQEIPTVVEQPAASGPVVSNFNEDENYPTTGPEGIAAAVRNLDMAKIERDALDVVKRKLVSKRPDAVKKLGYIQGFKRAGMVPADLLISRVPVIPPSFRPFAAAGDTFIPGDANELYRDLINVKDVHKELVAKLGPSGSAANKLHVYDAVSALYGYTDPVSPKTLERGVGGFLKKITGTNPKFGFVQRKLLAKEQDFVGRSVAGVDPDLGMEELGLPDEMAWRMFAPYIQRRLVRSGMSATDSVRAIVDKTAPASKMLDLEMKERPVMYSRSPAWHKFNVLGAYAKRIGGHAIMTNPLITTGQNLDFDGDSGRFILRIQEVLDSHTDTAHDAGMLKTNTPVRLNEKVIHIQNFPHLEATKADISPGVVEYDVPEGVRVYALNRDTGVHDWMPVTKFSVHEDLELWQVRLKNGKAIFPSSDHSLVAYRNGKMELVTPSDATGLCVPRVTKFARLNPPVEHVVARAESLLAGEVQEFKFPLNYDTGLWLGLVIGDGCVNSINHVYLYGTGDKVRNRDRFAELTANHNYFPYGGHVGESEFVTPSLGGGHCLRQRSVVSDGRWFSSWVKDQIGSGALCKHIPDFSFNSSPEHLWGIFDGLISTDGSICILKGKKKPQLCVNFYTSSPDLVAGFQVLAERLHVRCGVTPYVSPTSDRDAFVISVSTVDLSKRHTERPITFCHPEKNRIFQENIHTVVITGSGASDDQVPYPAHLHESLRVCFAVRNGFKKDSRGKTSFGSFDTFRRNGKWGRNIAIREMDLLLKTNTWNDDCEAYLKLIQDTSVAWEQIESATKMDTRMTGWDITVPGAFTFALDDGIIVQDTLNVRVPSTTGSVEDTKNKIMASKMLFSIKDREQVVPTLKQEQILGLYQGQRRQAKATHKFPDAAAAISAIRGGKIRMSDDVEIGR